MLVCADWLAVDFFARAHFALEVDPAGRRWAVRDGKRYEIPSHCGHPDCPAHEETTTLKEAA